MRLPHFAAVAALATAALPAQTASDVGLMMSGGILTVIYGQSCGPFTCQPFPAGPTAIGQQYAVYVYGAPQQPYLLAADLPSGAPCVPLPGVANALVLLNQSVTLAVGTTGQGSPTSVCNVGRGVFQLQFPAGTPTGVPFVLQGAAISASRGIPAFTVAIRSATG